MTEKQKYAIDTIISKLPSDMQYTYRDISEYAVFLGYKPALKGAQQQYVIFNKSFLNKTNRTILKIVADTKRDPVYAMEIRFFANSPPYPLKFQQAIKAYDKAGWMADCSNCEHCKQAQVYYVPSNDGFRKAAGCISLIHMRTLSEDDVPYIKETFKNVDDFYMEFLTDPERRNKDYYSGKSE